MAESNRSLLRHESTQPLDQEALRIRQKVLGSEHPDTAESLNNLALLYMEMGEYPKAEPLYQEAFTALMGQWRYSLVTDRVTATMRIAQRVHSLAQEQNDSTLMIAAYGAFRPCRDRYRISRPQRGSF